MAWYKLILGDALKLINTIEDDSIDCVITDPPYGIKYKSKQTDKTEWFGWDDVSLYTQELHEKILRKVKKSGSIYTFCSWKNFQEMPKPNNVIVWCKNNMGIGSNDNWGSSHEFICFYKKPGFQFKTIKKQFNYIIENIVYKNKLLHPTEKPVSLIRKLVLYSTKKNDTILDLFAGSGAIGVACLQTERNYIGFEINEHFYNIAKTRLEAEKNQQKLFI